jgi:glycosyltransferase involved in cell wall biosynthesis
MFESMAMQRPVVLGVRGQAAQILRDADAGLTMTPEDPISLIEAVLALKADPELRARLGENGARCVREHYDRQEIARRYWSLLQEVATGCGR